MQRYAPASRAVLAAPAGPDEIAAAEAWLGLEFPADLVESLGCHNGLRTWANVLPDASPLSVTRIVEVRERWMEIAVDDPDVLMVAQEPGGEPWWHRLWLPFGESGGGDVMVVDLRPGPGFAQMGWAVHDSGGDFTDPWPSLAAYLQATADALRYGIGAKGHYPYLTADGELWWTFAGETELNGEPLRRAPT